MAANEKGAEGGDLGKETIGELPWKALIGLLSLLWAQFFLALIPFWRFGTYYDYGWVVPVAAIWFFRRRQDQFPIRKPEVTRFHWNGKSDRWIMSGVVLALAVIFSLRIVERNDPFWRLPYLVHGATLILLHHVLIARFISVRNSLFLIPVTIFCLTAVPHPSALEQWLSNSGNSALMTITEGISHFQGFPVDRAGSTLSLEGEILTFDDGCSGIRSFQTLLMGSVFVGELFFLSLGARLLVLSSGLALALVFNGFRVVILTQIFFIAGQAGFDRYHDLVGLLSFVLSGIALWGIGAWMDARLNNSINPIEKEGISIWRP